MEDNMLNNKKGFTVVETIFLVAAVTTAVLIITPKSLDHLIRGQRDKLRNICAIHQITLNLRISDWVVANPDTQLKAGTLGPDGTSVPSMEVLIAFVSESTSNRLLSESVNRDLFDCPSNDKGSLDYYMDAAGHVACFEDNQKDVNGDVARAVTFDHSRD